MKLKAVTPTRLAVLGIVMFAGTAAWVAAWSYLSKRNDPPGWFIDRAIPSWTFYVGRLSIILVVSALIWAVVKWAVGRFSK